MPKFDNKRVRYLSRKEVFIIFSKLKELDSTWEWYKIALFALNTGMRKSELFNLTFSSINFTDRMITIVDTKSSKNRTIPLNNVAYNILLEKRNQYKEKNGKIFQLKKRRIFSEAIKNSGLNDGITDLRDKIVFHTFRHTFASWIVQKGIPLNVVNKLLGHNNLQTTMRYAHLAPSQSQVAVDIVACELALNE